MEIFYPAMAAAGTAPFQKNLSPPGARGPTEEAAPTAAITG